LALTFYNTRELISPEKLKLKILVHGLAGSGKTTFLSTAKSGNRVLKVGVCETGHGKGQLSVAQKGFLACDLNSYDKFDLFCTGDGLQDADVAGLDSLSEMNKTFIKDKALSMPRKQGDTAKRALGVPEIDDYGVMAELTRKLLRKLLDQDRHIIVTAGLRIDKPDPENGQTEMLIGPDLPGQMFLGSTAMFDIVLCLRTRSVLRNPNDAKSRYSERYFITENTGGVLAKNRLSVSDKGVSFLPSEVVFDQEKGTGTFDWFLTQAQNAYAKYLVDHAAVKAA